MLHPILITFGALTLIAIISLSTLNVEAMVGRSTEEMEVFIGVRRYDGKHWLCNDGEVRPVAETLPENERDKPVKLPNGEYDVLRDGNAWVRVVGQHGERIYMLTGKGLQIIDPKIPGQSINRFLAAPGQDTEDEFKYETQPTNFLSLVSTAHRVSAGRNTGSFHSAYKGTHFVMEFVEAITGHPRNPDNFPEEFLALDKCFESRVRF